MNDLITIIIPAYNVEKYLHRCIESIINQTYKNLEILLINDGSTDNSGKICEEYKTKDNRIKVFHTENCGVSTARNLGIKEATGKYMIFIDADDYIELDTFEQLLKKNKNYDCMVFSFYKVINNEKISCDNRNIIEILNKKEALIKIMDERYFQGFAWNKIVKRNVLIKNNIFYDEKIRINEDLLFWIQVFEKVDEIVYFSVPYYYYDQVENSAIHSKNIEKYITALTAYEKIREIYERNKIKLELYNINFFCINLVIKELLIENRDMRLIEDIDENLKTTIKTVVFSKEVRFRRKVKLIVKYLFFNQFCFCKKIYYKIRKK